MSLPRNGSSFSPYGWAVCAWSLIVAFQYGYHISALNQIQAVLTCKASSPTLLPSSSYLLPCIPMSDFTFSLVTSVFTIGGLLGSLSANIVMGNAGRRGTQRVCAVFIGIGTALMGVSNSLIWLLFGRFLIGIGSGLGLCVGPIFLAEIAPSKISGGVGVLTQLSIVFGIMFTQIAGINLAAPSSWRYVFFLSFCLSGLQLLSAPLIVESPAFLFQKGHIDQFKSAAKRLWGNTTPTLADSEEPLLDEPVPQTPAVREQNITIAKVFTVKELRTPLMVVSSAMLAQQFSGQPTFRFVSGVLTYDISLLLMLYASSGINAVLYYSNDILSNSLPEFGAYISLGITMINVIMTFPPIILIESLGRRKLLTISIAGQVLSLAVLGYSLDSSAATLASVSIITFVMSFAVGLGPVPFVMIPEVSPPYAVSALSSIALSLNWISNFIVGLVFLPVRNLISGGDRNKEGQVFYVFVALLIVMSLWLSKVYRPT